jgi:hypothetical protein
MAGDHDSRRFVQFRWVIAFALGIAAGTLSTTLFGITDTLWALAGCFAVGGALGVFEWLGQARLLGPRQPHAGWRHPVRMSFTPPQRKLPKSKPPPRRGQLHAIRGRKAADPPSSGSS